MYNLKVLVLGAKAPTLSTNPIDGSDDVIIYVPDRAAANYGVGVAGWTDELRARVKPLSQKP